MWIWLGELGQMAGWERVGAVCVCVHVPDLKAFPLENKYFILYKQWAHVCAIQGYKETWRSSRKVCTMKKKIWISYFLPRLTFLYIFHKTFEVSLLSSTWNQHSLIGMYHNKGICFFFLILPLILETIWLSIWEVKAESKLAPLYVEWNSCHSKI